MAKFTALMVLCLVVLAAVVEGHDGHSTEVLGHAHHDVYGACLPACLKTCEAVPGQGRSFCEMKCDTDCFNEDVKFRLAVSKEY